MFECEGWKQLLNHIHPPQCHYHFTLFMVINEPSPRRPRLNIWLPGVCFSVSLHKFGGGGICMWQVGTKCISGRAGDGSSKACSWKDVSHYAQLSDSFCRIKILWFQCSRHVCFSLLGSSKISPENHNSSNKPRGGLFACCWAAWLGLQSRCVEQSRACAAAQALAFRHTLWGTMAVLGSARPSPAPWCVF